MKVVYVPQLVLCWLLGVWNICFAQQADIILTNGKIFTADTSCLYVQALAISGNRILCTGSNAAIEKFATSKTRKIDLKGKTVVPGFNDQHDHAVFQHSPVRLQYATTLEQEQNWEGLSKSAVIDSIVRLLPNARAGEWIAGMIGTRIFSDTSMRRTLDSLAPNNPIALQVWWGHGIVTNQKGLAAAGLIDRDKDPVGSHYDRNSEGKISAIHINAQIPIWWSISAANQGAVIREMEKFGQAQVQAGITSTLFFGSSFSYPVITKLLQNAAIPQRLRIVPWIRSTPDGRQLAEWPTAETHPTAKSVVSGVKYVINHFGPLLYPPDTVKAIIRESLATHRQLMLHISGDSAFALVLRLIEASGTANQWRPLRCRVEHNMIGSPSAAQRKVLKDYGILIMHTPKFNRGSVLRSLLADSLLVGIGPDGTDNPGQDIMVITSQQDNPNENISREQAVIAYTLTNAYAEFREKEKGMLKKGMLADLAVLSSDLFSVPAQQLAGIRSVLTIIDGKIVYQAIED
ncbi:amidohydrolase [Flavihumibacter petaseus]|uniref:Putative hydrolase n=1 Tax=Flavihumibacter petaseus NBRC 106054 TaxID=1220578 RepID=A0A0E9N450_9BACT|nr:amidohydrolase family protein [Flavihumibacter petaseus]GAO44431.1 putative hydrolase [Flavihumibacter petaseus NBRC 106054]